MQKLKMQWRTWVAREQRHTEGGHGTENTVVCLEQSRPGTRAREVLEAKKALLGPRLRDWGVRTHRNFLKSERTKG